MRRFSIIIPTLNEEGNIAALLQRLEEVSSTHRLQPEIIFVDDISTDATGEIIRSYSGLLNIRVMTREGERGLAGAVVTGAQAAAHEYLVVMDADLSHPPEKIPDLLMPLQAGSADMTIGSRYVENGSIQSWPLARRAASMLFSLPARLLTGLTDPLAGFFATRTRYFKDLPGNMSGFKIGLELLMHQEPAFTVAEIPVTFTNRENGSSKMSPAVVFSYISQLIRFFGRSLPGFTISSAIGLSLVAVFLDSALIHLFSFVGHPPAVSHILSYLLALHCSYLLYGVLTKISIIDSARHDRNNSYWRFVFFISTMLFLRGGVLALLVPDLSAVTPELSLLLAVTTATSWLLSIPVFSESFVFRQNRFGWGYVLSFVVVYTILLRLLYMGSAELIQEEAYYWNYAQHLDWGYLDHPPGVAVLIKLGTFFFGNTEFGVRIGAMACWFLTAAFIWGFTRSLFNLRVAHLSLFFTATLPLFFGTSLLMTPDAPLLACWSGALFFFQRALIQHKKYSWLGGGICLGLGLASKYTIAFLGPGIVLFMVIDARARKYFLSPLPYLSALIALAIFSPVIWWNSNNDWASFLFQSQRRLASSPEFSLHELIASIILLITPVGMAALIRGFDSKTYAGLSGDGKTQILKRNLLLCLAAAAVPLSFFIFFSVFREIKLNWTAPIWITAVPVFALTLIRGKKENDLPWYNTVKLWPGMIAFLLLFYGGFLHYFTLGLPALPFPRETFMIGWRELGTEFEDVVHMREVEHGVRPAVVGMDKYRVASGLTFYRSSSTGKNNEERNERIISETTGRHLFGRGSLMYSHWHQPDLFNLKDIIVTSSNFKELDPQVFSAYAENIGPLESIMIDKHGQQVGPIYFRHLEGYKARQSEVTRK